MKYHRCAVMWGRGQEWWKIPETRVLASLASRAGEEEILKLKLL